MVQLVLKIFDTFEEDVGVDVVVDVIVVDIVQLMLIFFVKFDFEVEVDEFDFVEILKHQMFQFVV